MDILSARSLMNLKPGDEEHQQRIGQMYLITPRDQLMKMSVGETEIRSWMTNCDPPEFHAKRVIVNDSLVEKVYETLKYCPVCGKELEDHPLADARSCFVHGDFSKERRHRTPSDLIIVFRGMNL